MMKVKIISAAIIMTFSTVSAVDWPQFKRTADRHGAALEETISLPANLCSWFDFGSPITSSPAIVDGKAYVMASNGLIACLDLAKNNVLWSRTLGGRTNDMSPAVANGRVYAGSVTGRFYVLDAVTGNTIKEYNAGSPIFAAPLLLSTGVYFGSFDAVFHALDLNGNSKWRDTAEVSILHAAAFSKGQIVYPDRNTNLYWIEDSGTYAKRVKKVRYSPTTYNSNTGFVTYPMIWGDSIYIAGSEGEMANKLYYINFNTGVIAKQIGIQGGGNAGALVVGGASVDTVLKRVFAASNLGGLWAGWETAPPYSAYPVGIYGVNTPPAVLANCVVFGSENNQDTGGCAIHFYNKSSGSAIWSFKPATYKAISGGIAVGNGIVLAGGMDGYLYGFGNGTAVTVPVKIDTVIGGTKSERVTPKGAGEWVLTAFPNPAGLTCLTFDFNGLNEEAIIEIYSANGQLVSALALKNGMHKTVWNLKDINGRRVAGGRYHAVAKTVKSGQKKSFTVCLP